MNVALIGSGSWGTAVAGLAAARAERVTMWAHSEQTAAGINGEHRNPRYLVDYVLPENVVATTDLAQALAGRRGHHLCRAFDAPGATSATRRRRSSRTRRQFCASPRASSPSPVCS